MYKIYRWQNIITKKCYIGITKQATLKARFGKGGQGYRGSPRFYSAIKKYGQQSFIGQVLEEIQSREQAAEREKYYIKLYDSMNPKKGYNLHQGGFPEIEEKAGTRAQRISATLKKQRSSPEYRQLMSERFYSFWNDPQKRNKVLQKRKGKLTGRPAKALYCYQTDTVYRSLADASKALGISDTYLCKYTKRYPQQDFKIKTKHSKQYTLRRAR